MSEEIKEIIYDIKDSLNETPKKMYKYNKITFNLNELFEILKYVEQLENIRKEAVDYMKENCDIITIDRGWIIRSELTTTGLGKLFKILNKGDSK